MIAFVELFRSVLVNQDAKRNTHTSFKTLTQSVLNKLFNFFKTENFMFMYCYIRTLRECLLKFKMVKFLIT